ncbi:MAG: alanine dehydrogenase [Deltaproteobacteria bacterium]
MIVGVPREIKEDEYRVGMIPSGVRALVSSGHIVLVEKDAGAGSSIDDGDYERAGAEITAAPEEVYGKADLIVKVKEPRPREYGFLREGSILFTFLHLAADARLAQELLNKNITAIGYETVELDDGTLPILCPMSEVAGRLAVQAGAQCLLKHQGCRGVLLSGVPGVERGNVAIAGAGVVGVNAAKIAAGLGADVLMLDLRVERFRYIDDVFGPRVRTLISNEYNLEAALKRCDLLIGAVHIPGARTPRLITRGMLSLMKKGSVIVDVSVDQGGCVETIRPTTHSKPAYEVDGIIHYGVANMPGAVPRTSTFALTNATLPYISSIANLGFKEAVNATSALKRGVNCHRGAVTHVRAAEAIGMKATALKL